MTEALRTYSLQEVADILCGDDIQHRELWIKRRISSGEFRALRVGRTYRMTTEQLHAAIASLEVGPRTVRAAEPEHIEGLISGISSRRRRRRTSRRMPDL